MTLECLDCGSHSIRDMADDWTHGRIPTCPHCRTPLADIDGEPLAIDAEQAYCHKPHRHSTQPRTSYKRINWYWRPRDLYDQGQRWTPGERAEMAAHAEPKDQAPMEDR